MRWLASLSALGPLALIACGFDPSGLPPGHVLRDDTTADFQMSGAALDEAEIADPGLISPVAYVTGAALVKGANSELFQDPTKVDWNTLDASTPARVALAVPLGNAGDKAPTGVGVTQGDNWTVWLAGDLWLEAGTHTFDLTADDNGLLDLAPAAGATYQRVVTAQWFQGDQTGTFTAPADGWYPVRIAWSESSGMAQYTLRHQPPGGTLAPIDPDRFRVAVGAQRGLVADAFDHYYLVGPVGRSLMTGALLDQDFGTALPADTGITQALRYSFHWAGQFRIAVGGDYTLELDTDDGHRLRLDGDVLIDHLVAKAQDDRTSPLHLDAGWHDVVIDYTQAGAAAHARLRVVSGPDLAGASFPADRVRPVVPRNDRIAGGRDDTSLSFAAGGTVTRTFAPPIPPGATVIGLDLDYTISAQHVQDLQVAVIAPDGTTAVVRAPGAIDSTTAIDEQRTTHVLDGKAAAGTWKLQVTDASGTDAGNSRQAALTIHYVGGHAPIATTATYESAIRDLGETSRIDDVSFSAPTPTGTAVAVRLRTGASPEELMAQPWSDPAISGSPAIVAAGEFVQYRVELSSDGDHSPTFDWIQLVYRETR